MFSQRFLLLAACLALGQWSAAADDAPPSAVARRLVRIPTAHSVLTLCVEPDGRVYQLGYGAVSKEPGLPQKTPAREAEFLPAFGNGFILDPAIQATHADGNNSTDLIYLTNQTSAVDDNVSLTRI